MGIDAHLVVYAQSKSQAQDACAAAFARIAELDSMMSDYRANSELMQLCDHAGGPAVHVSPDLFKILWASQHFSQQSGGEFDITVGPLVRLWRTARKTGVMPPAADLAVARKLMGWRKLHLDPVAHTARLELAGMKLDLGGIAKGYADDEAQKVLKAHGITCALVEMGGDMVASNAPPGTKGWKIDVPNARGDGKDRVVLVADCAISTSGDEMQHVVIAGVRYSHVMDPLTGRPLTNLLEGTVTAKDGLTSDPLSKIVTLLKPKARRRLLRSYPGSKVFVRVMK